MEQQIAEFIVNNLMSVIFLAVSGLFTVIEVSKIKINPWSWIAKGIRKVFIGDVVEELKKVNDELESVKKQLKEEKREREQDQVFTYRKEIINAANNLRNGYQFTRSKYDTIIEQHARYNVLVDRNKFPNDVLEYDYQYIMERMHEADENGEFM